MASGSKVEALTLPSPGRRGREHRGQVYRQKNRGQKDGGREIGGQRSGPQLLHVPPKGRIPGSILAPPCPHPALILPSSCLLPACFLPAFCPAVRAENTEKGRKTGRRADEQNTKEKSRLKAPQDAPASPHPLPLSRRARGDAGPSSPPPLSLWWDSLHSAHPTRLSSVPVTALARVFPGDRRKSWRGKDFAARRKKRGAKPCQTVPNRDTPRQAARLRPKSAGR